MAETGSGYASRWRCSWLLHRASRRDESAAAELVRIAGPRTLGRLHWRFRLDPDEAKDYLHDAVFQFIRRPAAYRPWRGRFESIVAAAAINLAVDDFRKVMRQPTVLRLDDVDAASGAAGTVPFHDRAALAEELDALRAELTAVRARSGPLENDMIDLYLAGRMSGPWAEDLGRKHGVRPNTVSRRWGRLLDGLSRRSGSV